RDRCSRMVHGVLLLSVLMLCGCEDLVMTPQEGRKRNKKVAIKPLPPGLTVPPFDLCSPTDHWPSALGFVGHDAHRYASIASFSWVCVGHESASQYEIQPLDSYTFCWPEHGRHH